MIKTEKKKTKKEVKDLLFDSTYYCRDEGVGWDRVPGKEQE